MNLYRVLLGIDRAAIDTGKRLEVDVLAEDKLSAGITAEEAVDRLVHEPVIEYTHAMAVRLLHGGGPESAALAA